VIVMLAGATLRQALRIQRQHREVLAAERTEHEARLAAERESERAFDADRRARESLALATQAQRDAETEAESLEQVLSFNYLNGIARILSGAEDALRPRTPAPQR